jgi:hypothetical protein
VSSRIWSDCHVFSCFGVILGEENSLNVCGRAVSPEIEGGAGVIGTGCDTELFEDGGVERGVERTREEVRLGGATDCCGATLGGVNNRVSSFDFGMVDLGGVAGGCGVRCRLLAVIEVAGLGLFLATRFDFRGVNDFPA